eukprot:scaffold8416_cov267-Pinguiococcus_pyrenoidosus.AAC.1
MRLLGSSHTTYPLADLSVLKKDIHFNVGGRSYWDQKRRATSSPPYHRATVFARGAQHGDRQEQALVEGQEGRQEEGRRPFLEEGVVLGGGPGILQVGLAVSTSCDSLCLPLCVLGWLSTLLCATHCAAVAREPTSLRESR